MADEVMDAAVEADANSDTDTKVVEETSTDTTDKTIVSESTEGEKDVPPDWPDDWRDKLSKGDDKVRKRLDRFQSPADIMKSWQSLEQKLSSGDVKNTLPEGATDEEVAAYRKDNGIPETPDGYLENLPDGLVVGDEDKELFGSYLESVHGKNAPPEIVAASLDWYQKMQEQTLADQAEADGVNLEAGVDEMRAEWGNEYRANKNAIIAFGETMPNGIFDEMLQARDREGHVLGQNPDFMRAMIRLADNANPAGFVSPGAGGSQAQSVKDEIASIEKVMREDRSTYNKDVKMQERLRTLYDADAKLSA